jgi:hypothetical protein
MSGQLIGGVLGAAIGFFIGGPQGALYGYSLGSIAGGIIAPGSVDGPRLSDLKPQASEYGRPIPIVYGTTAMGGNVIWASDLVEEKGDGGGKGGGPSVTTFTYYANFAVAFCEGETTFGRVWAGPEKRLIWDGTTLEGGGSVRFYSGSEDQLPDPLIESYLGVGNVPAYRGTAYIVFERFPVIKDGNAIPFITAEVGAKAGGHGQTPLLVGPTLATPNFQPARAIVDPTTGWIWNVLDDGIQPAHSYSVTVINDATQEVIANFPGRPLAIHGGFIMSVTTFGGLVYVVSRQFASPADEAGNNDTVSNLAFVDVFYSGSANPDGSVNTMPAFSTSAVWGHLGRVRPIFYHLVGADVVATPENIRLTDPYGGGGAPLGVLADGTRVENLLTAEMPIYPTAAGTDGTRLWIAYSDSNNGPTTVAVYSDYRNFAETGTGQAGVAGYIGNAYQILGDMSYMGIAGSLGPTNQNFSVFDSSVVSASNPPVPLYSIAVPSALAGKAFDYDPKRKVFMSYLPNSMDWVSIDAASGVLTTHTLTVGPGDTSPAPSGIVTAITYSKKTDRYLLGASSNGGDTGTTIYVVNPDTFAVEGTYTFEAGGQLINPLLDPVTTQAGPPYVLSFDQHTVKRLYLGGAAVAAPMNLGDIVADLSARAGLASGQIDVGALTDMVDGYAIARQTTVRNAIDALRSAYYFDAVESSGKVKYVKRGGQSAAVIDESDLDARQYGSQPGDPLLATRQMEVELPRILNVNYMLAATDYSAATKVSKRLVGSSGQESTLDLSLVLSDTKAQEVADVNLHTAWVQRLQYGPFSLPRKYAFLEPTDIVTIKGYAMMLTKVTATPGGLLTCEAVAQDANTFIPHVVVTETPPAGKTVFVPGATTLELM